MMYKIATLWRLHVGQSAINVRQISGIDSQEETLVNSFEWNKIFGGVLAAALLIMVIRIVAEDVIFAHHDLEEDAFPIVVAEAETTTVVDVEEGPSLGELLASASAEDGIKTFRQCAACHTVNEGGKNGVGPNLYGVVGAQVAGRGDFSYSAALAGIGGAWTYEQLDAFLTSPRGFASGTKMSFAGLRRETDRAKVIQYLRSISPNAPELPQVAEVEAPAMMMQAPEQ